MKALGTKDAWGVMYHGELVSVHLTELYAKFMVKEWETAKCDVNIVPVTINIWANPSPEVEPLEFREVEK